MIDNVRKLLVKYNGRTVGILSEIEDRIGFQYDEKWVKSGFSLSPFSLPLTREVYICRKDTFEGLYGVFYDSLPDGWGELLVSRMLAKRGIHYEALSPLTKLSVVSENGLGGLTYEPSQADKEENRGTKYDFDLLAGQAAEILNDGERSTADLDEIYRLGGSSGGARPKAHIREGDAEWIVKFPCRADPPEAGRRELEANLAARECGVEINECRLFPSGRCEGYFGAKRFDRKAGRRLHAVSLSALLETTHRVPNLDYMHFFQVISILCGEKEELYEGFRRVCFNIFYGNKDDHGKNFAFLYDEERKGYRLTPAYDLTRTPEKAEHEMTVLGNGNPTEKDLRALAKEWKLSSKRTEEILSRVQSVCSKSENRVSRVDRQ